MCVIFVTLLSTFLIINECLMGRKLKVVQIICLLKSILGKYGMLRMVGFAERSCKPFTPESTFDFHFSCLRKCLYATVISWFAGLGKTKGRSFQCKATRTFSQYFTGRYCVIGSWRAKTIDRSTPVES